MGKHSTKNPMASNPIAMKVTQDPRNVMPRDQLHDDNNARNEGFNYPDGTVCTECGAIYNNQHWNLDEKLRNTLVASGTANEVICPACRIVAGRDPQGIVTLSGDYWQQHKDDIMNLIRNEEKRGMQDNPLERIMDIREDGDTLIVETTNEKLAQRIGRHIQKAHKGTVDYHWSDGNHLARIYWERSTTG